MHRTIRFLPLLILTILVGCKEDTELAALAKEANRQQSQQNQAMAKLNREVAEGSKRLIQAEAGATAKRLTMEQQLQEHRNDVEAERRQLAQERRTDSILGPTLVSAASLAAICLPLVLCWYLLHGLQRDGEPDVSNLLIEELDRNACQQPSLQPSLSVRQDQLEV